MTQGKSESRETARIALLTHPGRPLELREVAVPDPGPGEVLVRIDACAVCGSDLHTASGRRSHPMPTILGHEIAGTVVDVGYGAAVNDTGGHPVTPGDRITWSLCVSCQRCDRCISGLPQKCRHLFKYGHAADAQQPFAGGFADCIVLRRGTAIIRLPDPLTAEAAATSSCAVATAAAAVRAGGAVAGRSVVVLGAGMLGLSVASLAAEGGAASVTVLDPSPERLALVSDACLAGNAIHWQGDGTAQLEKLVADALTSDGADLVVEASGAAIAAQAALCVAATGGTCVLAGTVAPVGEVPLDPERVVRRHVTIRGVHNYIPADLIRAVDHLASPAGARLACLAGPTLPLDRINEALAVAASGSVLRVVVAP